MLKNLKWFVIFQLPAVDFLQTACIDLSMQYFFSDITMRRSMSCYLTCPANCFDSEHILSNKNYMYYKVFFCIWVL